MRSSYTGAPFGLPNPAGSSDQQQVSGLDWDSESYTGHAWARQYNPTSGQWMSPDPYGGSYNPTNPQSFNRYAYVGNDPMSYSDPLGLARWDNAPDPDAAASNTTVSISPTVITGCHAGAGDLCRAVVVAAKWLWSVLSAGNKHDPGGNDPAPEDRDMLEANAVRSVFVGGLHIRSAPEQPQGSVSHIPTSAIPDHIKVLNKKTLKIHLGNQYTYEVENRYGKPITGQGRYEVKEHISTVYDSNGDQTPSEDNTIGIPLYHGQFVDNVGGSVVSPGFTGERISLQTFSVIYRNHTFYLSTVLIHDIKIVNGIDVRSTAVPF